MSITNCVTCGQYIDTDLHSECTRCGNEPMERFPATDEQPDGKDNNVVTMPEHPDTAKLREAENKIQDLELAFKLYATEDGKKLREAAGFIRSLMDLTNPVGLIKYKIDAFLKQIDNENK